MALGGSSSSHQHVRSPRTLVDGIGVVCGLATAIVLMRLMSSLLFKVAGRSPDLHHRLLASCSPLSWPATSHRAAPPPSTPSSPARGVAIALRLMARTAGVLQPRYFRLEAERLAIASLMEACESRIALGNHLLHGLDNYRRSIGTRFSLRGNCPIVLKLLTSREPPVTTSCFSPLRPTMKL